MNTFSSPVLTARHTIGVFFIRSSLNGNQDKGDNPGEVVNLLRLSRDNLREKTWLYAGKPENPLIFFRDIFCDIIYLMNGKVNGADNQQGSLCDPSETIRRAPFAKKEILAYLNGAVHDATLNKGKRIRFSQKNKQWLEILQKFLREIGCNSWIYKEGKNRNVFVLETLCKNLDFRFNPLNLTDGEKTAYIRGFFDAEGGVPHKAGRFYIQLVQKDFGKIQMIKTLLKGLGIESGKIHNPSRKIDPDYWRIFISSQSHRKFAKVVNSYHPLKAKILCERMKI